MKILEKTRTKLIVSFLGVSFLVGMTSLIVGAHLLYQAYVSEASGRIETDLNAARLMVDDQVHQVQLGLEAALGDMGWTMSADDERPVRLLRLLENLAQKADLDMCGVVDVRGRVVARIGPDPFPVATDYTDHPLVGPVLRNERAVAGPVVIPVAWLAEENPMLAHRARVPIFSAGKGRPGENGQAFVEEGMLLAAAVPVFHGDALWGVAYGAVLVNGNAELMDRIRDTVFRRAEGGRPQGTVTLFLGDLRIATNVRLADGGHAEGTRAQEDVSRQVLEEGRSWVGRAWVVGDWFMTSYEPLTDAATGDRIGMLCVGVPERPYVDVRNKALLTFMAMSLLGISTAIVMGSILERRIMWPVHQLIKAARQVSQGDLSPQIEPVSHSELGVLQKTFKDMLASIRERENRQRQETEDKLFLAQKQASVGRLAAGVAHEINNPLTGVLTFSHLFMDRQDLPDDVREGLKTIADATERVRKIVKGLLDFSRQTALHPEPTDLNRLILSTVALMENQALIKGVELKCLLAESLPPLVVDPEQMRGVFMNLLINALDATAAGGTITVTSRTESRPDQDGGERPGVSVSVVDTGCGIPEEHMGKLFDPFFTTKQVGQGTGLGLSVSYGIVARHGGRIFVNTAVGSGTTFTVWLPLQRDDARE
ncbi:Signal transduction histidine kinase [Desulfacinum hydrothermale DSM 13146]|uniref:histidine kinase n=1 Tax=Desulfacinum hydrothermale DSM 13146 TaxID=1121390 RepID=A0A1W1X935_9BACT|nr:cache domain-containing protein [Desulfacinum hydrothermale]SMC20515.1 Signal transduction histidine kinase [Desulfacinum hydrothermale DSM 13146]